MSEWVIDCQSIHKSYEKTPVLADISFRVATGSCTGIIGLNGAGKTTLIKTMLGLAARDSGRAFILGKEGTSPEARKQVMFLPEKFQPSPYLKGREHIAYALSFYGQAYDREAATAWCTQLGLAPKALDSAVKTYSKGMMQKLGLVTAMLTKTPLLILDEPMSGLDPKARILLRNALKQLREQGRTVVFTSHILADIDTLSDHLVVIHQGNVVYSGELEEFRRQFNGSSTETAFMHAIGEKELV